MRDNTNKQAIVSAIWANPEKAFGCRFRQSGRYMENAERNSEYDERGKIRLLEVGGGSNIMVFYNGGSRYEKADVFTYLQQYVLNTSGFKETLVELAKLYGISLQFTAEEKQVMGRAALSREICNTFVEALRRNPEGATARYIRIVRGLDVDTHFGELSLDSIRAAQDLLTTKGIKWGYDDFKALGLTEYNIQQGYTCVIPYYCNGYCRGFVLRNTRTELPSGTPKYHYSEGLGRLGYCDTLTMEQPAVVVEGQLDAIRLIQAGLPNVIAMGGAKPSEDVAKLLRSRRISEITYIPDVEFDEQGKQKTKIIADAIQAFQSAKVDGEPVVRSVLVSLLDVPDGVCRNGYKIDADSYGLVNGSEALATAVEFNATPWYSWELKNLLATAKEIEATQGQVNINWFRSKFNDIYTRCGIGYERQAVRTYIQGKTLKPLFEAFDVTPQALLDIDEWNKDTEYNNRVKDGLSDLNKAVAEGASPVKIAEIVGRLSEAQATNAREEWAAQLAETFDDELKAIREQPDALKTKWELGNINRGTGQFYKYSNVEFWPADISVVCAVSSHGKTTFLVQSALDMVAQYPEKTFLYISCEENKRQLTERVLNTYLDIPNTESGKTETGEYCFKAQTRKKTIKAVIRGSVPPDEYGGFMGFSEHYDALSKRINDGIRRYGEQVRPRLKLIHTEASTESICNNVRYYIDQMAAEGIEVGGVFVDYMQLLSTDTRNFSRHDELKDICKALKECAAKTEIPFVVAAQLNRAGIENGIDSITMANIGEGADIERIAHDIYFVWQIDKTKADTYFQYVLPKDEKGKQIQGAEKIKVWNYDKAGDRANRIFTHNELRPTDRQLKNNYLYVEHIKARDGKTGGWGLLKWDGESGRIGENDKQAMAE